MKWKWCVTSSESTVNRWRHADRPVFHRISPEEWYKWMRSSLFGAMMRRLLLDRIETTIGSSSVSENTTNAGLHVNAATFPHLVATRIRIQPPCMNFAIHINDMFPHRVCKLGALLYKLRAINTEFKVKSNISTSTR